MGRRRNLWGEIDEFENEHDEIVKIAWEAVEKRRVAEEQIARKIGKQQRLDGTVLVCRGYATYEDYDEYMERKKREEQLKLATWDVGRIRFLIRKTLLALEWTASKGHRETRFYPPSTEFPKE